MARSSPWSAIRADSDSRASNSSNMWVVWLTALNLAKVSASMPDTPQNLLTGIALHPSLSPEDIAYLENRLQFLHDRLPEWSQYVEDAKPFTLTIDTFQSDQGRQATAVCCDANGSGTIS